MTVFQRTGNWFLPRKNRAYPPAVRRRRSVPSPGCSALRRRFWFWSRRVHDADDPPPAHDRADRARCTRPCSCARSCAIPRSGARRGRTTPSAASGSSSPRTSCPRCSATNVELVTEPSRRSSTATACVTADGRRHEVDCLIWGTGFRTNDFMLPMEIDGRDGRTLGEAVGGGAHAHLGIDRPRLPVAVLASTGRTRTPRAARSSPTRRRRPPTSARRSRRSRRRAPPSRCARRSSRPATARVQERFDGHGVDAVRLLVPRRHRAASSPTGRATCTSTCARPSASTAASTCCCARPTARRSAPEPYRGRHASRGLVRRRLSLVLHRQAPPRGRPRRLRARRRGRGASGAPSSSIPTRPPSRRATTPSGWPASTAAPRRRPGRCSRR